MSENRFALFILNQERSDSDIFKFSVLSIHVSVKRQCKYGHLRRLHDDMNITNKAGNLMFPCFFIFLLEIL